MIVIACVDDRKGMMFNRRRQSRDAKVCRDILRESMGKKLYVSQYSGSLFEKTDDVEVTVCDDMLSQAGEDDFCFIENTDIGASEKDITKVILYHWNRHYPADRYFPLVLSEKEWELVKQEEFAGSSHEKITKEEYRRRSAL